MGLLLINDYRVYYVLLVLGGISFSKDIMIYVYLLETVPEKYRVFVASYKIS